MVGHAADAECRASRLVEGSGEIHEQLIAVGRGDEWVAVLGAEDEMDRVAGEGLRHESAPALSHPFRVHGVGG